MTLSSFGLGHLRQPDARWRPKAEVGSPAVNDPVSEAQAVSKRAAPGRRRMPFSAIIGAGAERVSNAAGKSARDHPWRARLIAVAGLVQVGDPGARLISFAEPS